MSSEQFFPQWNESQNNGIYYNLRNLGTPYGGKYGRQASPGQRIFPLYNGHLPIMNTHQMRQNMGVNWRNNFKHRHPQAMQKWKQYRTIHRQHPMGFSHYIQRNYKHYFQRKQMYNQNHGRRQINNQNHGRRGGIKTRNFRRRNRLRNGKRHYHHHSSARNHLETSENEFIAIVSKTNAKLLKLLYRANKFFHKIGNKYRHRRHLTRRDVKKSRNFIKMVPKALAKSKKIFENALKTMAKKENKSFPGKLDAQKQNIWDRELEQMSNDVYKKATSLLSSNSAGDWKSVLNNLSQYKDIGKDTSEIQKVFSEKSGQLMKELPGVKSEIMRKTFNAMKGIKMAMGG